MTSPAPNLAPKSILLRTASSFVIGTVGGLASVFLPRMMLLLSIDTEPAPQRYISVFQLDFVWLGLVFALAIGLICAILEYGTEQEPRAIFMTALGIPALLSGVLNTTSATNKLQKLEQEKVAILRAVSDEAGISQERLHSLEPLGSSSATPEGPGSTSALDPFSIFVTPAFAQSTSRTAQQPASLRPWHQDPATELCSCAEAGQLPGGGRAHRLGSPEGCPPRSGGEDRSGFLGSG